MSDCFPSSKTVFDVLTVMRDLQHTAERSGRLVTLSAENCKEVADEIERLRAPEPGACPTCDGVGGGVTRDGIEIDCSTCNGTGAAPPPSVPAEVREIIFGFDKLSWFQVQRLRELLRPLTKSVPLVTTDCDRCGSHDGLHAADCLNMRADETNAARWRCDVCQVMNVGPLSCINCSNPRPAVSENDATS